MRVYDNGVYRDATPEELAELEQARLHGQRDEIASIKIQLAETDYKVTKNAECYVLGLPLPYDAEELHKERQALRDRINELEKEL